MSSSRTDRRTWHLSHAEDPTTATLVLERGALDAERGTTPFRAQLAGREITGQAAVSGDRVVLIVDGVSHTCHVHAADAEQWLVHVDGRSLDVGLLSERALRRRMARGGGAGDASPLVASPMAGRVVAVKVQPGAAVEAGQTLVILEAMKMENDIKATRAATVESLFVAVGDAVEVGTQLLRFATGE